MQLFNFLQKSLQVTHFLRYFSKNDAKCIFLLFGEIVNIYLCDVDQAHDFPKSQSHASSRIDFTLVRLSRLMAYEGF